jgi:hypothetical protein
VLLGCGSFITWYAGVDGQVLMSPNEPARHVYLDQDIISIVYPNEGKVVEKRLPYTAFTTNLGKTYEEIQLGRYYPYSESILKWREPRTRHPNKERERDLHSGQYYLFNDMVQQELVMSLHPEATQFESTLKLGPLNIHYLPSALADCFAMENPSRLIVWDARTHQCYTPEQKNVEIKTTGKKRKIKKLSNGKVGLYVITFNSPSQFETLLNTMHDYDPDFLDKTEKFLLNNSTDLSTTKQYEKLCEKFNFQHIKKDNIGITGGRVFIADHFDQTDLDHYMFFEDDMLFYNKKDGICKNGFNRYVPNIYSKILEIMKKENFDFLKFNFTEFFGSHEKQWSWYNVPQSVREKRWPNNPHLPKHGQDPNSPNLEFKNIKSLNGLPYANGEIYLSNWPIIMSKEGNYKCYLQTKFSHPYEQTLMSHCYQETIKGNINSGLLLLTPTEHNRFDFYPAEQRKEC